LWWYVLKYHKIFSHQKLNLEFSTKLFLESLKTLCQPGPCGANADCYVTGSNEQCYCKNGYSGNPYDGCISIPTSPCEPNPCGKYAYCKISSEGSVSIFLYLLQ